MAIIGSGQVGETLARGFSKYGYAVMRGSRDPSKLEAWKKDAGERAQIGDFAEAAAWGDTVVLAVKGSAARAALELCGAVNLEGKIIVDATNPIADAPPEEGVLRFTTGPNESSMEQLQDAFPKARFVKAFNSVGSAFMVDPDFGGEKPTMFICGDDDDAKGEVTTLLEQFGWDVADMGAAPSARAIEPLCMLWCIPGMRNGSWSHAFRLLRS